MVVSPTNMDRDTRQSSRQSSLPASLIPHLYVAPRDSSTRTTLSSHSTEYSEYDQRSSYPPSRSPLSLAPLVLPTSPSTSFLHKSSSYPFIDNNDRQLPPVLPANHISWRLPPLQHLSSFEPSFDRRDTYSYPQVGSLSISGSSPPNYLTQVNNSPDLEQSYGSESHSADIEGDDDAHKDKKRRAHSMDIDDNPKKSVRKTAVACNFCRGRKLRCNGAKPSCYNCTVRKFECEYVSTQRRRGPGKAPKGSRSRKGRSDNSASSSKNLGDRLPNTVPDYELSPDLQPFTSVLTLEKFEFQLPNTSPQYPSDRRELR